MPRYVVFTMLALLLVASVAVAAPATKTFSINCDNGQTISQKLSHPAKELILEISGFCNERVVIERPNVTIRGASASTDGIAGPVGLDPTNQNDRAMVTVKGGVKEVHFENLLISGSENRGLEVLEAAFVSLTHCRISGNEGRGLQVNDGGFADVLDSEISDNGREELMAWGGGQINCTRCSISDDNRWAVVSNEGGRVFIVDSDVIGEGGNFRGLFSGEHGKIFGQNTNVTSDQFSLRSSGGGQITWVGGEIVGAISMVEASQIFLYGVEQTANEWSNSVLEGSYLLLSDSWLVGLTELWDFSTGSSGGSTLGGLACHSGADFFCDGSVTKTSSTCGKCPP